MPPALVRRNSHSLVKAPPPPSDKRRVVSQAPASSAARRIRDDDEGAAADAGASSARPPRRVLVQRAVAGFARSADGMQITRLHGAAGSAPGPPRLSVDFKRRRERDQREGVRREELARVQCFSFSKTGYCSRTGGECGYAHDPGKVGICQAFLHGTCTAPEGCCALSHEPSAHNMPTCRLYLLGVCDADAATCAFRHVRYGDTMPCCPAFGKGRWCDRGAACTARHEMCCDEHAATGVCPLGQRCKLRLQGGAGAVRRPPA